MGKHYMKSAMEHEIEARLAAATPGQWWVEETTDHRHQPALYVRQPVGSEQFGICAVLGNPEDDPSVRADGEFIAHAPQDMQVLINIIAALRAELAAIPE